ncbi:hypothetical protein DFR67_13223 [Williamsia limnetica]|uniref:Uncharacterized protein n=2 Tax=Williamsia limnetica TaxID=882452 RepID=A0A318RF71_WILLI|nr:hypothetical protein DFR67_13223 [Williamsia limnetica]
MWDPLCHWESVPDIGGDTVLVCEGRIDSMKAEILFFDGCPNWVEAAERVRAAATMIGRTDIEIAFWRIESGAEAAASPFAGSPTILIDGVDAFVDAVQVDQLACRVYRTETGLSGLPTINQLADALRGRS